MGCDDLWPHVVTIHKRTASNFYGESSSDQDRRVRAYVEPVDGVSRTATLRDETFGTPVIVEDVKVQPQDEVTLPTGERRVIQNVARYDFEEGMEHSVVGLA